MRLHQKSLLAVLSLVTGLIVLLVSVVWVLTLHGFARLEEEQSAEQARHAARLLQQLAVDFRTSNKDWAEWSGMADYLASGDDRWRAANIAPSSYKLKKWASLSVVRADGTRVWHARLEGDVFTPPSPDVDTLISRGLLVFPPDEEKAVEGLALIDGMLHFVAAQPIRTTDRRPGPARGALVMTRWIDPAWVKRLQELTGLQIEVYPLRQAPRVSEEARVAAAALTPSAPFQIVDRSNDELASYSLLQDLSGSPIGVLQIVQPRPVLAAGLKVVWSVCGGLLVGSLLLAVAAVPLLRTGLLVPLSRLVDGAKQLAAGKHTPVLLPGRDELATLAGAFNHMSVTLIEREREQREVLAQMRLILHNTGDGLATFTLDGALHPDASAPAIAWFGPATGNVWQWLHAEDPEFALQGDLALEQLREGHLPLEILLDQLPTRLVKEGRVWSLRYRPVFPGNARKNGPPQRLLILASDITERLEKERTERDARELQQVIGRLLRDRPDFTRFVKEVEGLLEVIGSDPNLHHRRRALHTLKGNAAIYGFSSIAEAAHAEEALLAAAPDTNPAQLALPLRSAWEEALARVAREVPLDLPLPIELSFEEHQRLLVTLQRGSFPQPVVEMAKGWTGDPIHKLLARLQESMERIAGKLGKPIQVSIQAAPFRVDGSRTAAFWSSLIHVARNALDHGVESEDERRAAGKPAVATIQLEASLARSWVLVTVSDDGRGVDWSKVAEKAAAKGLPAQTQDDLVQALFNDGLSTRDAVSELSGRGVGLGAVKAAIDALDGGLEVTSNPGEGTSFHFFFPLAARSEPQSQRQGENVGAGPNASV